jgi:hypothetical protein
VILKEEIRRHERNAQRADYAANLEYVKNVILKFIEAREERDQLIPVLGTLLHFSKEELARALRLSQQRAEEATAGAAGQTDLWSSFLTRFV